MRESKRLKWTRKFHQVFADYRERCGCPPLTVVATAPDRMVFRSTPEWIRWLDLNCDPWNMGIKKHRPPGVTNPVAIRGWRDKKNWAAAQFIRFIANGGGEVIEVDFDLANPGRGGLPLIAHGLEYLRYRAPKLWGGEKAKTSPFIVERWMKWRDKYSL